MDPYKDITDPKEEIELHLKLFRILDVPKGRHDELVERYCADKGIDNTEKRYGHILSDLHAFNDFLENEDKFSSGRSDIERQAVLEPDRTEKAIKSLEALGYQVEVISTNEISFVHNGAKIRYFPYSGWASGKTIRDGRGLNNLLKQLKP